jgi:L,D-transpeptidase YcbB
VLFAKAIIVLLFLIYFLMFNSCKKIKIERVISQDSQVYRNLDYSSQKLDSCYVNDFLENEPSLIKFKEDISSFYRRRNFQFAWFSNNIFAVGANTFINALYEYQVIFHDSTLIDESLLSLINPFLMNDQDCKLNDDQKLLIEIHLTAIFFKYANRVYYGIDKNIKDLEWFIPRKKKNFYYLIDTLVNAKAGYEIYEPVNSFYKALKNELKRYSHIEKEGLWCLMGALPNKLIKGDRSPIIEMVKDNLFLTQDYLEFDHDDLFDECMEESIKLFQKRNGFIENGMLDESTFYELNQPISYKIKQIMINLERLRWMPDTIPNNYLLVNIPDFKLHVYENGLEQWNLKVVVGKQATATNIFMGILSMVVFSPFWNIPSSIIINELIPKIKRNKNYLSQNNMEILKNGKRVSGSSIQWSNYKKSFPYTIRQKPGKNNALGQVKFVFPNHFNIYLHDTPAKELFNQTTRAFSHGCIRLSEPQKLAKYLLRFEEFYTENKINELMYSEKETIVQIKPQIPVIITYLTSWVDDSKRLQFRKDIYGHDKRLYSEIFGN